jgi:hypothetical protein
VLFKKEIIYDQKNNWNIKSYVFGNDGCQREGIALLYETLGSSTTNKIAGQSSLYELREGRE